MRRSVEVGVMYEFLQAVIALFAVENRTYLFFAGIFNSGDDQSTGELPQLPLIRHTRLIHDYD
jgi:hypothetical protein